MKIGILLTLSQQRLLIFQFCDCLYLKNMQLYTVTQSYFSKKYKRKNSKTLKSNKKINNNKYKKLTLV